MEKFLKFYRVEPWRQLILIQAFIVQLGVRVALGVLPFYLILSILQRIEIAERWCLRHNRIGVVRHLSETSSIMQDLPWAVRVTSPFVPGSRCLCQAITAKMLLALKGFSSELRIGVRKSDVSILAAHAWLIRQGQVLVGQLPDIGEFITLPNLSGLNK